MLIEHDKKKLNKYMKDRPSQCDHQNQLLDKVYLHQ
jgi:hypothetical protein